MKNKEKPKEEEKEIEIEAEDTKGETSQPGSVPEKDELTKQRELAQRYLDLWQHERADFDNFRKRSEKEKGNLFGEGIREAVSKFLPVADSFERALKSQTDKETGVYKGLEMIEANLKTALAALGVEAIKAEGEFFDPALHEALMHCEDGSLGDCVVAEELQKGYMHQGKVIRHSMVKVAN